MVIKTNWNLLSRILLLLGDLDNEKGKHSNNSTPSTRGDTATVKNTIDPGKDQENILKTAVTPAVTNTITTTYVSGTDQGNQLL